MRFRILLLISLVAPGLAFSQQDDYPTINNQDTELAQAYGQKFPGYYLKKDGTRIDCLIQFEEGSTMNFNTAQLNTSMAYNGEPEYINKPDLQAFFVNNRLYLPATVNDTAQWINVTQQGAIRKFKKAHYSSPKYTRELTMRYDEEKEVNVAYMDTTAFYEGYWYEVDYYQKLGGEPESPIMPGRKFVMAYVADYDDLYLKIQKKEKGYKPSMAAMTTGDGQYVDRMFTLYNKWYDENNPGEITYYDMAATYKAPDKPTVVAATSSVTSTISTKAKAKEPHLAPRIDVFKGRPDKPDPSVASAKPEVPVKKESFKERLNRISNDGNKVGILVTCKNLVVNPKESYGEGVAKVPVRGSYEPLTGLDELARVTAERLNNGFNTDVFEVVDYSVIPVKKGKSGKMDDWWSTKYKMIVFIEITPAYHAYIKTDADGNSEFNAQMSAGSEMIMMAAEDAKPDRLRYVTSSPKYWGGFRSDKYQGEVDNSIETIQELKTVINPPADAEVIEAIIKEQPEYLNKFVKKKSK